MRDIVGLMVAGPDAGRRAATRPGWRREVLLVAIGCGALSAGVLVYLTDRHGTRTGPVFGSIGQWLPSGVHALAFSLFTAAALGRGAARRRGACAAWCTINLAFEVGQHAAFKPHWAAALHAAAGDWPVAGPVLRYLLAGTFDVGDLLAIVLGALAAGLLLEYLDQPIPRHASR